MAQHQLLVGVALGLVASCGGARRDAAPLDPGDEAAVAATRDGCCCAYVIEGDPEDHRGIQQLYEALPAKECLSADVGGACRTMGACRQAEAGETMHVYIDSMPWQVTVADGTLTEASDGVQRIATPTFTLELVEWPPSQFFAQTLAEHKSEMVVVGTSLLHEREDAPRGDFELVVGGSDAVTGIVLRSEYGTGARCSFTLDRDGDWGAALAACQTLRPIELEGRSDEDEESDGEE